MLYCKYNYSNNIIKNIWYDKNYKKIRWRDYYKIIYYDRGSLRKVMRERINYIDYTKGIAILFVVFGHIYCENNINLVL